MGIACMIARGSHEQHVPCETNFSRRGGPRQTSMLSEACWPAAAPAACGNYGQRRRVVSVVKKKSVGRVVVGSSR